jgi:hypothetical protein
MPIHKTKKKKNKRTRGGTAPSKRQKSQKSQKSQKPETEYLRNLKEEMKKALENNTRDEIKHNDPRKSFQTYYKFDPKFNSTQASGFIASIDNKIDNLATNVSDLNLLFVNEFDRLNSSINKFDFIDNKITSLQSQFDKQIQTTKIIDNELEKNAKKQIANYQNTKDELDKINQNIADVENKMNEIQNAVKSDALKKIMEISLDPILEKNFNCNKNACIVEVKGLIDKISEEFGKKMLILEKQNKFTVEQLGEVYQTVTPPPGLFHNSLNNS